MKGKRGGGGRRAEKAEFQGGNERICRRPSTRRPSFKSKTNPGPATGRPARSIESACGDARECASERTGERREQRREFPHVSCSSPPEKVAFATLARRNATLTEVAGVLRARKTTHFLYLREDRGGGARATRVRACTIEKSPCRLTISESPGGSAIFARDTLRRYLLAPEIL